MTGTTSQVRAVTTAVVASGRWRRYLALAAVFAVACAGLSWWQFARGQDTASANAVIARNWSAAPLEGADAIAAVQRWQPRLAWHPVRLTGDYVPDRAMLVRNRPSPVDGSGGYEVLEPLRLVDGSLLMVDRGWVAPAPSGAPPVPPVVPRGRVTVTARLVASEGASNGALVQDGTLHQVDLAGIARLVPGTDTGAYGWIASESPSVSPMPQALTAPSFDTGLHLSYAIQWILFALIAFGALAWSVRRDLRDAGEESVLAADARAATRRSRRSPSDEAVEDSLTR